MVKRKQAVKVKQTESSKKIPVGVQIISVLYYIAAVVCVLTGLLLAIGANAIVSLLVSSAPELESIITGGLVIGLGILLVLLGVLAFFVGRALWKLKQWARILAIIVAIVGVAFAVYSMIKGFAFMQVIKLAIHAAIGIYLIFSKEVKEAFK